MMHYWLEAKLGSPQENLLELRLPLEESTPEYGDRMVVSGPLLELEDLEEQAETN